MQFELLKKSFINKRLAHFYIFSGEKNEIKLKTALKFMMLFYEEKDYQNILKLNHLNLQYIKADGKNIRKEQINNLLEEFNKTSLVDGPRFFIIDEAEKLNIQSSNSLLKFLEETPDNVYGILITENIELLPTTIISRAQTINFTGANKKEIETEINNEYSSIISNYTNILDEAVNLSQDMGFIAKINYVIELMENLAVSKTSLNLYYVNHKIDNIDDFIVVAKLLYIYYSDILKYLNNDLNISFRNQLNSIKDLSKKLTKKEIYKIIDELEEAVININFNLKIESLMNKIIADM